MAQSIPAIHRPANVAPYGVSLWTHRRHGPAPQHMHHEPGEIRIAPC
jgi:hypothetical protein